MATTANDQINGALRLLGVLAEGETPSAATSQDALAAPHGRHLVGEA